MTILAERPVVQSEHDPAVLKTQRIFAADRGRNFATKYATTVDLVGGCVNAMRTAASVDSWENDAFVTGMLDMLELRLEQVASRGEAIVFRDILEQLVSDALDHGDATGFPWRPADAPSLEVIESAMDPSR